MLGWVTRGIPRVALVLVVAGPVGQRACDATPPPGSPPTEEVFETVDGVRFRVEVVATNLEIPWSLAFTPDGRLFFAERPGRVRIIENGSVLAEPALTLDDVFARGEAGLLGLALHPRFDENGYVYLVYTVDRPDQTPLNRVMRYRELAGSLAEGVVIFDAPLGNTLHDGARLRFGPDGKLYLTMGDALDLSLPQDLASSNGKIFRLEDDGRTPADNPFGSPVYTYGHRNPQGLDWHPITGDLWGTEHGATGNDEINLLQPGRNYGWSVIERRPVDGGHGDPCPGLPAVDRAVWCFLLHRVGVPCVRARFLLRDADGQPSAPCQTGPTRLPPDSGRRGTPDRPFRPDQGRGAGT